MEDQNKQQVSKYNNEHGNNIPDYRTKAMNESNMVSTDQSINQKEVNDPVIRATIDKFNNEIANEEKKKC